MGINETLCIYCHNALPSIDGKRGCSWSRDLIPVEGWKAEKTVFSKDPRLHKTIESFKVLECPEYCPDLYEKTDTKNLPNDGFINLAGAIVQQAVKDYKHLLDGGKPTSTCNFKELESFFENECDYYFLQNGVGEMVLDRLEKYREECDKAKQDIEK